YARALERLQDIVGDLERAAVPAAVSDVAAALGPAESNTSHDAYLSIVEKAKEYIRAGDIFQVVPSQRFRRTFSLPPFALYRALARLIPSPFLYCLILQGSAMVGSSPRFSSGCATARSPSGPSRARARAARPLKKISAWRRN